MKSSGRKQLWSIGIGLFLTAGLVVAGWVWSRKASVPPGPKWPVYGRISDFQLTNQLGRVVTRDALRGKVVVADIVFTRCPSSCPRLTRNMSKLQKILPPHAAVRMVTLTTDPTYDTPAVLKRYGKRYGANAQQWWFLTGTANEIAQFASSPHGGLMLAAGPRPVKQRLTPTDLFIHSTRVVLVDQQGRIRKYYNGLKKDMPQQILKGIKRLLAAGSDS